MPFIQSECAAFLLFWDVLQPGDNHWPAASVAISSADAGWEMILQTDRAWLIAAIQSIAVVAPTSRVPAMQALEQAEPAKFGGVLKALCGAYYAAPAVHEQVRILAERGPRESCAYFDTDLLQQVIETQAGLRRM